MNTKVKDIDEYISMQDEEKRSQLEELRQIVKSIAPDSEEVISYGMPAFKFNGMLVGFASCKNHCGFYPWKGHTVDQFKEELKDFTTTKGSIHFPLNKALPEELIRKIVKARLQENLSKSNK